MGSNVVTLRLRLAPDLTFRQVLARARACVVGTSPHTDFPYELLCDELNSECGVAFDARIYDPGGVRGFLERFQALAAEVCAHPDRSLGAVLAHT